MAGVNPLRQIFLSCVTDEFGAHRQLLKGDLSLPGVAVREQQDFVQGGGNLLEKLDGYLSQCDAVIHLVGEKTGHAAKRAEIDWLLAHYPDFLKKFPFLAGEMHAEVPAISYTQLEAWLALFHGCACHIYRPATFDSRPLAADDPQLVHWNHLRSQGTNRGTFDDEQELCRRVLRGLGGPSLQTPNVAEASGAVSSKAFNTFLSHSHEDAAWVEALARQLEDRHHFHVWLDKWILTPAQAGSRRCARA